MSDTELMHYGILGMKWGVRRSRKELERARKARNASEDSKKASRSKKRDVSELSNEELRELNNRMQLERTYRDLTKSEISPGKKFVQEVLRETSKELAKEYLKKGAKYGIDYGLTYVSPKSAINGVVLKATSATVKEKLKRK